MILSKGVAIDQVEDKHDNTARDLRRPHTARKPRLQQYRKRTCHQTPETHNSGADIRSVSVKVPLSCLPAAEAAKKQIQ